jgi:hypothetical protein
VYFEVNDRPRPLYSAPRHSEEEEARRRAVNLDVHERYYAALVQYAEDEPRISIKPKNDLFQTTLVIYVDGGHEWAYVTWAGFGQEDRRPIEEWRGHVVLSASTEQAQYELLDMRNLDYNIFKYGDAQARIVINAVKAHIESGFAEPVKVSGSIGFQI